MPARGRSATGSIGRGSLRCLAYEINGAVRMNRQIRVLMAGFCSAPLVVPFVEQLRHRLPLSVSVFGLEPGGMPRSAVAEEVFEHLWFVGNSEGKRCAWRHRLGALLRSADEGHGIYLLCDMLGQIWRDKTFRSALRNAMARYRRAVSLGDIGHLEQRYGRFDVWHLMAMFPESCAISRFCPVDAKLIVSILGSDLLRGEGTRVHGRQLKLCERADVLTVRSLELRDVLLEKFGRHLEPKIRIAKFGSPNLAVAVPIKREAWRDQFDIPAGMWTVCVGNNGSRHNQHIAVIHALSSMAEPFKRKLCLLLPMSYGMEPGYDREVQGAADLAGLNARIITEKMETTSLLGLRAFSDVMIHVPVSDALSAAMCETLYAGNPVITGAWLPYGELRRRNVPLHKVRSMDEIPARLQSVLEDLESERQALKACRQPLREVLDWGTIVDGWVSVYTDALGLQES